MNVAARAKGVTWRRGGIRGHVAARFRRKTDCSRPARANCFDGPVNRRARTVPKPRLSRRR
eukprot:6208844-Alexandrium_andersonii.AAC.1